MKLAAIALLTVLVCILTGCEAEDLAREADPGNGTSDSGADADADSDADGDADGDTDGDADDDAGTGQIPMGSQQISGIVKSATGFPISGALVYLTSGDGPEIPDTAYCYECDEVPKGRWALSNPDGTWRIDTAPEGTYNIVTRKGGFQRQREVTIADSSSVQQIPEEITTLPGADSADGMDQIPHYAVLLNDYDYPENLLAKMGLGDLNAQGKLVKGTEQFDLYNESMSSPSSVGPATAIFTSQDTLNQYHMVFFPCTCTQLNALKFQPMLLEYVTKGGKIYSSCYAGHWVEKPFPEIIEFTGADNIKSPGSGFEYNTFGTVNDPEMRDWLAFVAPMQNPDNYPFREAWITIDGLSPGSYDGHGVVVNDDGTTTITGPVIPDVWVTDNQKKPGQPLTLTFNYDCGKVFYSTFHVVMQSSMTIAPQEWVLIYLFYEIGVCEGEHAEVPPV